MKTVIPILDAEIALREAVYGILSSGIGVPVYDDVPSGKSYPYVEIGEGTVNPWTAKLMGGEEITLTFHVFSRYEGYKEVIEIAARVLEVLMAADVVLAGSSQVITCELVSREVARDADGLTRNADVRIAWRVSNK